MLIVSNSLKKLQHTGIKESYCTQTGWRCLGITHLYNKGYE